MKIFYWLSAICFFLGLGLVENKPFWAFIAIVVAFICYKVGDGTKEFWKETI
jgi:hypothetical protein